MAAALFGSFVFALASIRVPAVPPDPAGFAAFMERRQAYLTSGAVPSQRADESVPRIQALLDLPSHQRMPARADPPSLDTHSRDHSTTTVVAGQAAPLLVNPSERLNVLILGVDAVDRFVGNTDVIMLLGADLDSGSAAIISFPRDLCVADCNRSSDRLSGIYSRYGAEAILQVMSELTGQPIEYYATVNFEGVARIIDRLGGVGNYPFDKHT